MVSIGLPVLLLLIFIVKQIFNLDNTGWLNGFNHPLTGWDHLITMLAVGIWAAQLRGRAIWMLPLAFVGVMSLGGLAGTAGLAIPSVEGIILLSAAVFSVLITRKLRFSTSINLSIVAFFAFFHGFAHGQEISTSASLISYTLGFMLATLLLHGAGILLAKLVIFTITCLLTLMFSNAALAKSAESNLVIQASNKAYSGNPEYYKDMETTFHPYSSSLVELKTNCRHDSKPNIAPFVLSNQVKSEFHTFTSRQKFTDTKSNLNHSILGLNKAVSGMINGILQLTLSNPDLTNSVSLDFKSYYPDINHTPGQALLSNGVGLTSPPLLHQNAFAIFPPISPEFRNTSIISIQETALQWRPNRFDTLASNKSRRELFHPAQIISGGPFGSNLTLSDKPNTGLTRSKIQVCLPVCAMTGSPIFTDPHHKTESFEIDSRFDLTPSPKVTGDIYKTHSLPSNRNDWQSFKPNRLFITPISSITNNFEIYA